jgi:alkylhydroperoxidase/carboxymuconolactone decarboxylase family protein YurZ
VNPQPAPLPLDEAAEAQRAKNVRDQFGFVAAGLVEHTTEYLFRDLWLRPDLAPRGRSLVTVATLIASGWVAQITYLNRAMDNELTQEQAAEVIIHLAFCAALAPRWSECQVTEEPRPARSRSGLSASSRVISIIVRRKLALANKRCAASFRSAVERTTRGAPRAASSATAASSSIRPTPWRRCAGSITRS